MIFNSKVEIFKDFNFQQDFLSKFFEDFKKL